jgi:hypothetical protein
MSRSRRVVADVGGVDEFVQQNNDLRSAGVHPEDLPFEGAADVTKSANLHDPVEPARRLRGDL